MGGVRELSACLVVGFGVGVVWIWRFDVGVISFVIY